MKYYIKTIKFLTLCILFLSPTGVDSGNRTLLLAVHPYLPFAEIKRRYDPLAQYISKKIDIPVEVRVGANYKDHITNIGNDRVDIAFLGPASYVKLVDKYGFKPFLGRLEINGKPYFQGKIIIRKKNGISSLRDLKKKLFAFGDPASTMSHLVPRYMLLEAGIKISDLSGYQFLGSHTNVALGVLSGDFDAGAVKEEVFNKFRKRGLRVLKSTPKISEHLFVTRSNMPESVLNKLKKTLFNMNKSREGLKILNNIKKGMTAIVSCTDSDYNNLRIILKKLARHGIK